MNKKQFINVLKTELSILKDSELDDIIKEYSLHIDEEVSRGVSEEKAVEEFGNVRNLAMEILDAYQINTSNLKEKNFVDKFINSISRSNKYILSLINSLPKGRNFGQKISLYTLYAIFWSISLTALIQALIFLDFLASWGGVGHLIFLTLIFSSSIIILYIGIRITFHVFKKS